MGLLKKQKNILRNRLENIVEKIKSMIRGDQGFPSDEEICIWLKGMVPKEINLDKPAQVWASSKTKKVEVLFFYGGEMIYLLLKYHEAFYKKPYIEFYHEIIFINDLYPEDFIYIRQIMRNLRRKFDFE